MAEIDYMAGVKQEYAPDLYAAREVHRAIQGWASLGPQQIAQYRQTGFLAIEGAFAAPQVAAAQAGLADLIMGRVPGFDNIQFEATAAARLDQLSLEERELAVRKIFKFCAHEARLDALMHDDQLQAMVRALLGDREPRCFQEMALLKPPGGREKPWHQDHAYFNLKVGEPVVGVWIALDDATVANGCMHVIPGSHRQGPRVHFKRRDWQICDTEVAKEQVIAVPLRAGGLMLFDGLLQHGTPANPTDQRRRALQYHYCPADAQWVDQTARLAVFGEEGKDVTC
ncbi:MAG: phytanoyl-CoA dioxygenase family protein [Phycisphaeraceae bacterium]